MIVVNLEPFEIEMAAVQGIKRRVEAIRKNSKQMHGADLKDAWAMDIEGACGEIAVAKSMNRYWDGGVNTYKRGDLQGNVQVRHSASHSNRLIVRKDSADADVFIFVTGMAPTYHVWGWIYGRDAKREEWLAAPNGREPAYFVPKTVLKSVLPRQEKRSA